MKIAAALLALAATMSATPSLAMPSWMIDKAAVVKPQGQCYDTNATPEQIVASCTAVLRQVEPEQKFKVLYSRANAYVALGRYEDGIADLDAAVSLEPDKVFFLALRCRARTQWGQEFDKALADCNAAVQAEPDNARFLNARCVLKLRMGRYPDAASDCASAYKLDPSLAQALYAGGLAKLKSGDVAGGNADIAAAKLAAPGVAEGFARYGMTP